MGSYRGGSPYEFKIANTVAGAARVDYRVDGLRVGVSGYAGNTFSNTLTKPNSNWEDVKGLLTIGAVDFDYSGYDMIVRGGVIYGHLSNSDRITAYNKKMRNDSPSPKTNVASDAISAGVEAGYDIFAPIKVRKQKFYLFARYDFYDSMLRTAGGILRYDWCGRHRVAAGVNYYPIPQIVVKGSIRPGLCAGHTTMSRLYQWGVAYTGFFTRRK